MRRTLSLVIAAALVAGAAWFFIQRSSSDVAPHSPKTSGTDSLRPEARLKESESVAPANSAPLVGISEERKRLIVQAAFACQRADRLRDYAKLQAKINSVSQADALTPDQRANLQREEGLCASDPAAKTAPVEDFLIDLANAGNAAAAACYVSGSGRERRHAEPPTDDPRYRRLVPLLVERGVAAGDWRMVSMASSINTPRQAGSQYTHLSAPDPVLNYQYIKLMQLGAVADEKNDLQMVLASLGEELSPADRKRAEAKAEEIFKASFAQKAPYSRKNNVWCADF